MINPSSDYTGTLTIPRVGLVKAKAIIEMIEGRAGGDAWWHEIEHDTKTEIPEEIATIIESNT
jgi:hypothetical protein